MERNVGLAVAGAISMVVLAGTLAVGANLGVFGSDEGSVAQTGAIEPTAVAEDAQVVKVEVRDPSGRLLATSASGAIALSQAGNVSSSSSSSNDDFEDDDFEDDDFEDDDSDDEDHSGHARGGHDDEDDD